MLHLSYKQLNHKDEHISLYLHRRGAKAFLELLLPRLKSENCAGGGHSMPFELEVLFLNLKT